MEPISGLFIRPVYCQFWSHSHVVCKAYNSQIEAQSTADSDGVSGAGRCADSESARCGFGRVASGDICIEDRRTIVERSGTGCVGVCGLRAVTDGHDNRI